jgi:hypothetical protein
MMDENVAEQVQGGVVGHVSAPAFFLVTVASTLRSAASRCVSTASFG